MPTRYKEKSKPRENTQGDFYSKSRKRKMMGGTLVEDMQADMKKKMEKPRGGYAHGGYASIADMEKKCGSKTQKNTMK